MFEYGIIDVNGTMIDELDAKMAFEELENELELYRHYVEFVPSSGDVE